MKPKKPKKRNKNLRLTTLAYVLKENHYPTLNSLAITLKVSDRQVRRDIDDLNSLGARIYKSETRKGGYALRDPGWKPYFVSATGRKLAHIEDIRQAIRGLIPADRRDIFRKEFAMLPRRDMVTTVVSLMKALLKATGCPEEQARILSCAFKEASPKAWLKAYHVAQRKAIGRTAKSPSSKLMSFASSTISMPVSQEEQYPLWIERLNKLTPEELKTAIDSLQAGMPLIDPPAHADHIRVGNHIHVGAAVYHEADERSIIQQCDDVARGKFEYRAQEAKRYGLEIIPWEAYQELINTVSEDNIRQVLYTFQSTHYSINELNWLYEDFQEWAGREVLPFQSANPAADIWRWFGMPSLNMLDRLVQTGEGTYLGRTFREWWFRRYSLTQQDRNIEDSLRLIFKKLGFENYGIRQHPEVCVSKDLPCRLDELFERRDLFDLLGVYDAKKRRIILYDRLIKRHSINLKVEYELLKTVVLTHEIGHWIAHQLPHIFSASWPSPRFNKTDSNIKEGHAQLFCYWAIEGNKDLLVAFERLLSGQSNKYKVFQDYTGDDKATVCRYLLSMRRFRRPATLQDWGH